MKPKKPKRVTKNGKAKWMIRWWEDGRDRKRFFDTKDEAKFFAQEKVSRTLNLSTSVAQAATDDFVRKAVELSKRLDEFDATLEEAVDDFIKRHIAEGKSMTLGELREQFVESKENEGVRPETVREARGRSMRILDDFGSETKISTISPNQVAQWLDNLKVEVPVKGSEEKKWKVASNVTKNNYRKVFHAMMEFALKREAIDKNPVSNTNKKRVERKLPEIFEKDQMEALLKGAEGKPNLLAWIGLGAFAGIRPNEMERLEWKDISLETNKISIPPSVSKTRRKRIVDIRPKLKKILEPIQQAGGPVITAKSFTNSTTLQNFRKTFSFKWSPDVLRHSFGTFHLAAFRDAGETSLQMGHGGSTSMLFGYYDRGGITKEQALEWWDETPEEKSEEKPKKKSRKKTA